jgi:hypothetical protein
MTTNNNNQNEHKLDPIVREAIESLADIGLALPSGTTADNLAERIVSAVKARKKWQFAD